MKKDATITLIEKRCKDLDLAVATYAPGEGIRQYRFFRRPLFGSIHADYHQGDGIYTALGRKEAITWLDGYEAGSKFAL